MTEDRDKESLKIEMIKKKRLLENRRNHRSRDYGDKIPE